MAHIVVVGSVNMDLVVRTAHMPAPGETVLGQAFQTIPGGKGANQAVGCARLGGQVTMIGRVGNDTFGEMLRIGLKTEGIDISHIQVDPKASSGIAMITLDDRGQNSIVVASGANMELTAQDVRMAFAKITKPDVIVLQLESPLECVETAARLGRAQGAQVILNPAPARDLPDELLALVDILVPNESETNLLTGLVVDDSAQAETAALALLARGVGAVVLTLGARGGLVFDGHGCSIQLAPHIVPVVDTTAAGDALVAGLSVGISEGLSLIEAARLGNACGALATTRLGGQPSMPTRSAVEALLRGEPPHFSY